MPVTKSAKKKMRQDRKKTLINKRYIIKYKKLLKEIKKSTQENLKELISKFYSVVDKAVKKKVIYKNKGNRLKSKVKKYLKK